MLSKPSLLMVGWLAHPGMSLYCMWDKQIQIGRRHFHPDFVLGAGQFS